MILRPEQPHEQPAIRAVHLAAFESPAEANLVEELRALARPLVSWVAEVRALVRRHHVASSGPA
jgi:putative acetyltransferase